MRGMLLLAFFWILWFLLGVLCTWGVLVFAGLPVVYKTWVTLVCLLLDTPLRAEIGGGITFVTSGENTSNS